MKWNVSQVQSIWVQITTTIKALKYKTKGNTI